MIKPRSLNPLFSRPGRLDKKAPKRIVVVRTGETTQWAGRPAIVADSGLIVKTLHTCPDGLPPKPVNQGLQTVGKRGLSCPDPPDRAVVLCDDGKSRVRAPDRTRPGVPLKKGRAATMTQDYRRHSTTMLFVALGVTSGMVIGDGMPRHRAKEVLNFLRQID